MERNKLQTYPDQGKTNYAQGYNNMKGEELEDTLIKEG